MKASSSVAFTHSSPMFNHPHLTTPKLLMAAAMAAAVLAGTLLTGEWTSAQQVLAGPVGVFWILGGVPAAVFVMLEVPGRWARWIDAAVVVVLPAATFAALALWASLEPKTAEVNATLFNTVASWAALLYLTSPPHSEKQQRDAVTG